MILNRAERLLVSNPVRGFIQRHLETRRFLGMGGPVPGGRALEIGCGPGYGIEAIFESFGAAEVEAFDLDPRMVDLAGSRLRRKGLKARLWTGDAVRIEAESERYDAVFDFFIIHHVPNWRAALAEVCRVLRPGGKFYAGEVMGGLITNPIVRRLLAHPQTDRFDHAQFRQALIDAGLSVAAEKRLFSLAGWFVAVKPGQGYEKSI